MKRLLTFLALPLVVAGCATPSQMMVDAEVKRLCAIDGGIKVYETVKLPAEKYNKLLDKFGRLWIAPKDQSNPTDDYYSESQTHYYRQGSPEMSRRLYRIVRRSDEKILGELVFYGRGGGDMPGPWHDSSFTCPAYENVPNFEPSIFVKGEKNGYDNRPSEPSRISTFSVFHSPSGNKFSILYRCVER